MGLVFPNVVGLAAGYDRSGELAQQVTTLGFGFAEFGTVTPHPEPGHNAGVDALAARLHHARRGDIAAPRCLFGTSIAMNAATPPARAIDDYARALHRVWGVADYVTVNLSGRAAAPLHATLGHAGLEALQAELRAEARLLAAATSRVVPLVVKLPLPPDPDVAVRRAHAAALAGYDGLIAAWEELDWPQTQTLLRALARHLGGALALIATGGMRNAADVRRRLDAGADLVQLYGIFAERGLSQVRRITRGLLSAAASPTEAIYRETGPACPPNDAAPDAAIAVADTAWATPDGAASSIPNKFSTDATKARCPGAALAYQLRRY
jgi:dihydroorotate dehydrogenase